MATKNGGKNTFQKKLPIHSEDILGAKNFVEIAGSKINVFLYFIQQ